MVKTQRKSMTTRLDINPDVVARAKGVFAVRKPEAVCERRGEANFRDVVDYAIDTYLDDITKALDDICLLRGDVQNRQRPVSVETWTRLGRVAEKYDISKVQLVRCALAMLGRSADEPAPPDEA